MFDKNVLTEEPSLVHEIVANTRLDQTRVSSPIRREILRARLEGLKMHVTYIHEVVEGWSHRFLEQRHAEVFMRSRCWCTRLLTFWLIIRLIKCECSNEVVREVLLLWFCYISVQPSVR